MKLKNYLEALVAITLIAVAPSAVAQERSGKDSIAGKAAAAQASKNVKPAKAAVQPATTALKPAAAPEASKPAGAESMLGHGKDGARSSCHSRGSDA